MKIEILAFSSTRPAFGNFVLPVLLAKIQSSGFLIFTPDYYKLKGRSCRQQEHNKADIARLLLSSRDPIPYLLTGLKCFIHKQPMVQSSL